MIVLNKLSYKAAIISVISVILIIALFLLWPRGNFVPSHINEPPISNDPILTDPIPLSLLGNYSRAAVVTGAPPCSDVAKNILLRGGTAVDAMISAMLCEGVTMPQYMGIGGGFFMTILKKSSGEVFTINAREVAPAAATYDMFSGNPKLSQRGGLSIAIPGEVRGYWEAYKKFGSGLPWKELFEPTIHLCEQGIPINKKLADVLTRFEEIIKTDPEFRILFTNKTTGELLKYGETYKNMKLATTLRTIAEQGGDTYYEGPIAKDLVNDIREAGGIITEKDLKDYQPRIEEPFIAKIFDNMTLYTTNAPSSGPILAHILKLVNGLIPARSELLNTQRITEAIKYAYGARSRLGDPKYVDISKIMDLITSEEYISHTRRSINDTYTWNDPAHYGGDFMKPHDQGTSNLAVIAENGDAVVATSTINDLFGSAIISKSTGIILNDEMDDFSSPNVINIFGLEPSKANFIAPGKIPLSSMTPSIVTDKSGDIRLLIGAAGGTKITTGVAIATIRALVFKEEIRKAVNSVFFHHQLSPMVWQYRPQISKDIVEGMQQIGHKVVPIAPTLLAGITAIEKSDGQLHACSNYNRPGQVAGY